MNAQKVGRIPVGIALVVYGVTLLTDTLGATTGAARLALRLWPVLLIICGLEYLVRTMLAERRSEGAPPSLRFDWGGMLFLALVAALGSGVSAVQGFVETGGFPWGHHTVSRYESQSVPAAGVRELVVDNRVGRVELQPTLNSDQITVEARLSARSQEMLSQMQLRITPGESVRVQAEYPSTSGDAGAEFVVFVPKGIRARVDTGTGSVRVVDHTGDLNLTTRTGRIEVETATGSVTAASGTGSVDVRNVTGPVVLRSNAGRISATNVTGDLNLDAGTGSVHVDEFRGSLTAQTNVGSASASTNSLVAGDIMLKTRTGSISLAVPQTSSIQVNARTQAGSIALPGFSSKGQGGPNRTGTLTLGDGKNKVELETGMGSIAVNFR